MHLNLVIFDYTLKQASLNNRPRIQAIDHFQTCIIFMQVQNS